MLLSFTPPATFRSSKRRRQSGKSKCEFLLLGDSDDDHNDDISEKEEDDDDDDDYDDDNISDLERLNDDGDDEDEDSDSRSGSNSSSSSDDDDCDDDDGGGSFSKRHKSLPPPHRNYHHEIIMQLSILTPLVGVRLEFLQMKLPFMPSTKYMSDLCLTPPGFSSPLPFFLDKAIHLTVRGWGCENCYMENCYYMENEDDCEFGLFMPDETAVSEIKVAFHVLRMSGTFVPHEKTREVSVQNMCGSCIAPYQLDLSSLQYISKTKKMFSSCESFSTVTGNFVLCSNKFRVDFRGVRSISAMRSDWKLITGLNIDDVSTTLYLLVLKGCVGKAVAFHDRSSHDCCYLIQQTAQWCTGLLHFGDICDVIELDNIQWARMPCLTSKTICDTTLKAKINVHISRKGGTVIRLVFSPPTSWDASIEQDVISDCNFLLDTLSHILNGKVAAHTMAFLPRVPPLCCPAGLPN